MAPSASIAQAFRYVVVTGSLLVASVHCGARSEIDPGGLSTGGSSSIGSSSGGNAGGGGAGGTNVVNCLLRPVGEPTVVMPASSGNNFNSPHLAKGRDEASVSDVMLVALASGAADHPRNDVARLVVEGDSITVAEAHPGLGFESHSWADIAYQKRTDRVVIGWTGDPGGQSRTYVRGFSRVGAQQAFTLELAAPGSVVLGIAAGAQLSTADYGVVFRVPIDNESVRTQVVIVDDNGTPLTDPLTVGEETYPGVSPTITWSGERYWLAWGGYPSPSTGVEAAVLDVDPNSGQLFLDGSFTPQGKRTTRPRIAWGAGAANIAFAAHDGPGTLREIIWARKSAPQSYEAQTVTARAKNTSGVAFAHGEGTGPIWAYVEQGDSAAPSGSAVQSRMVLWTQSAGRFVQTSAWIERLFRTRPAIVAFDNTRRAVLAWPQPNESGRSEIVAQIFECVDTTTCETNDECPSGEFCRKRCCEETGTCAQVFGDCNADCPGVTACGGEQHCNACIAEAAGESVPDPACGTAIELAALNENVSPQSFTVSYADLLSDRCYQLVFTQTSTSPFAVDSMINGWSFQAGTATKGTATCTPSPIIAAPDHSAITATGSIEGSVSDPDNCPSWVSYEVTLDFGDAPGAPPPITLKGHRSVEGC